MKESANQNPGTTTGSKTQKNPLVPSLAIAVVMLGAALATGLVIRHIRSAAIEPPMLTQAEEPVEQSDPQIEPMRPETPPLVQAPVQEEPPPTVIIEPEMAPPLEQEPYRPQMGQGFSGWNFNLTEEEQAGLREGFMTLFQRFQNMSEEERQVEIARFNTWRERFENMSDQERQRTLGRVQQQIEQWRQNGGSPEDLMNNLSSLMD